MEAASWPPTLQADVGQAAMSAAAASAEAASQFMSKFGDLSVGGGGRETDTGVEAGSASGEADDVFKSMDAESKVCMQKNQGEALSSVFCRRLVRRLAHFTDTNGEPTCSHICFCL